MPHHGRDQGDGPAGAAVLPRELTHRRGIGENLQIHLSH